MDRRWRVAVVVVSVVVVAVMVGGLVVLARDDDGTSTVGAEAYAPVIDPGSFTAEIDNSYLPLQTGTRWVYEGTDDEGGAERIVVEVMPDTREVMGVTCVVVRDTVSVDGEVIEDTYDWYAQDADGNVWYFGEDTTEYEDGKPVSNAGAWEAGVDGAQPGIVMKVDPKVGDQYRQEYYAGEAEDMGEVVSVDDQASVPFGSYDGVLVISDTTPLEPGIAEHKYYAEGVGLVLEEKVEGGTGRAELVERTGP